MNQAGEPATSSVIQSFKRTMSINLGLAEISNHANHLWTDPALRLALGKDAEYEASQSMLCRLENGILGADKGMAALDETRQRSIEADCLGVRLRNGNVHSAEGALHARKWHVHVSTAFHVAHHYHEVFNSG
jgi:hypothetical protein